MLMSWRRTHTGCPNGTRDLKTEEEPKISPTPSLTIYPGLQFISSSMLPVSGLFLLEATRIGGRWGGYKNGVKPELLRREEKNRRNGSGKESGSQSEKVAQDQMPEAQGAGCG